MRPAPAAAWEADLLWRAGAGDHEAFAELVGAHVDRAYAVALGMTGSRAAAWDVVEDSMVFAWQHLDALAGRSTIATWLTRIVIDTCRHRRRAPAQQAAIDALDRGGTEHHPGGQQAAPEQAVVARAELAAARVAIASLPVDQRAASVLHTLAGYTRARSAQVLGISEAAARVRAHRARLGVVDHLRQRR